MRCLPASSARFHHLRRPSSEPSMSAANALDARHSHCTRAVGEEEFEQRLAAEASSEYARRFEMSRCADRLAPRCRTPSRRTFQYKIFSSESDKVRRKRARVVLRSSLERSSFSPLRPQPSSACQSSHRRFFAAAKRNLDEQRQHSHTRRSPRRPFLLPRIRSLPSSYEVMSSTSIGRPPVRPPSSPLPLRLVGAAPIARRTASLQRKVAHRDLDVLRPQVPPPALNTRPGRSHGTATAKCLRLRSFTVRNDAVARIRSGKHVVYGRISSASDSLLLPSSTNASSRRSSPALRASSAAAANHETQINASSSLRRQRARLSSCAVQIIRSSDSRLVRLSARSRSVLMLSARSSLPHGARRS